MTVKIVESDNVVTKEIGAQKQSNSPKNRGQ